MIENHYLHPWFQIFNLEHKRLLNPLVHLQLSKFRPLKALGLATEGSGCFSL